MTFCKQARLADSSAQLYMLFYYLGPSSLVITLLYDYYQSKQQQQHEQTALPSKSAVLKACGIALFDIFSQALNYTGAGLAGSTIFAVIYSSVTIWTACWSRLILKRSLSWTQWLAVFIVFGGLSMSALDSAQMGPMVRRGASFVVVGSAMHGMTYVLSEAIMSSSNSHDGTDHLTVRQNAAIQSLLATVILGIWQLVYTVPHWQDAIAAPMQEAGTSVATALWILSCFSLANLVHALSFYHTLKHYPGGSTSAGVMKGFQAVLVFVATHVLFCGRTGGREMCFSPLKLASLLTVVTGVAIFGHATERLEDSAAKRGYSKLSSTVVPDHVGSEQDTDILSAV